MEKQFARNERARKGVLAYLAGLPSISLQAETIHRQLHRETGLELAEVVNALNFLLDEKLICAERGRLGGSLYFQVTSAGTLEYERSF